MASVIAVHTWRIVPLAAVIMIAGIISIPKDINDAAAIDGAGFWRRLWEITLPLTLPVVAVAALFGAILTFTDMTVVYVLTNGGPENADAGAAQLGVLQGHRGRRPGAGRGDRAVPASRCCWRRPIAILRAVRRMETF